VDTQLSITAVARRDVDFESHVPLASVLS
jgi:hypothetical protein